MNRTMSEMDLLKPLQQLLTAYDLDRLHRSFVPMTKEERADFVEQNNITGRERDDILIPQVEEEYDEVTGIKTTYIHDDNNDGWIKVVTTFDDEVVKLDKKVIISIKVETKTILKELNKLYFQTENSDTLRRKLQYYNNEVTKLQEMIETTPVPHIKVKGFDHMTEALVEISSVINDMISGEVRLTKSGSLSGTVHYSSFKIIKGKQNQVNDLYSSLIRAKFIKSETTSLNVFRDLFNDSHVSTPIVWYGSDRSIAFFIRSLINKTVSTDEKAAHLISNPRKGQWDISAEWFIREDGRRYKAKSLMVLKPPAESDQTKLNKALKTLD